MAIFVSYPLSRGTAHAKADSIDTDYTLARLHSASRSRLRFRAIAVPAKLFWSRKLRSDVVIWFDQFNVRDAECLGQFVKSNHGRVPSTALETAEILLAEAGARFNFFLGQVFLPTQAGKVPADQFAHIHAQ
ncbi:hypothetical protein A6U89_30365 [Agrobacterium sp. B133/95]|nr:hypothetical protein A6U89_30365 [Agrobacterium sp. B133/95]